MYGKPPFELNVFKFLLRIISAKWIVYSMLHCNGVLICEQKCAHLVLLVGYWIQVGDWIGNSKTGKIIVNHVFRFQKIFKWQEERFELNDNKSKRTQSTWKVTSHSVEFWYNKKCQPPARPPANHRSAIPNRFVLIGRGKWGWRDFEFSTEMCGENE